MKITSESQLKLGKSYWYADCHSPNLEHQLDCVSVYKVTWNDWSVERETTYGFKHEGEVLFRLDSAEYSAGRNPDKILEPSYMSSTWIQYHNFYDSIVEAARDAVQIAFTKWKPFTKK